MIGKAGIRTGKARRRGEGHGETIPPKILLTMDVSEDVDGNDWATTLELREEIRA